MKLCRAALFSELETRVGTVIDGGGSMFCWVGKTWLQGSAGSKEGLVEGKMGPSDDDGDSNGKDARQEEGEEARSKCTEREEVDVGSKEDENALSSQHGARSDEIIPITPECEIINGVAVTQRSSPRKRVKNRNRSRERLLDNAQECVAVARSLMVDQVGHVGHSPGQKSGKSIQAVGNIETGFRDRRKSGSSDGDEGEECMGETVENVAEAALRSGWEKGNIGNWNEVRDVDGDCDKHQRLSV